MLLVMLMAIPLIGALVVLITRDKSSKIPFAFTLIVFFLSIFILKDVFRGVLLTYRIPMTGPLIMTLQADAFSAIFLILASFLWLVVSIYSPKYMEHEEKAFIFQLCTLLTLFSVQGVFLAGNLLTMLLFFELMTITSYFWVVHRWNKESIKAGYFYLFFSITGGLLVALGIALLGSATDVLPLIGSGMVNPSDPKLFAWSIVILILGFGIKAGMVPLHLWLPRAYTAAPIPSSVLLAGTVTKVGVYGLIRVGEFVGWGINLDSGLTFLWPLLVILGTWTMLLGIVAALIESDAKKLLAYSSISQIGYIILGLGIALYLGSNGGFGFTGSIYHIINHSLFKSALFLGVGIMYMYTGETDIYKLGGLWRRFPVTAILMLIAVLGAVGGPGLNGYASKSLLHHGINLAAGTGVTWLAWIEGLFLLAGIGTAAYFSKLYYLIFLGKPSKPTLKARGTAKLNLAMGLIVIVILGIGIRPEFLLNVAVIPTAKALGMETAAITFSDYYFWTFKDIFTMLTTMGIGIIICWVGLKRGAFHWQPPAWMTIEGIVKLIASKVSDLLKGGLKSYNCLENYIQNIIREKTTRLNVSLREFDQSKTSNVLGLNLIDINADIGILFLTVCILLVLYLI